MTLNDESTQSNRKKLIFNTYQSGMSTSRRRIGMTDEDSSPLLNMQSQNQNNSLRQRRGLLRHNMKNWVPGEEEVVNRHHRSWRRRIFLVITEPETSLLSAAFYFLLISAIFLSNMIMVMQTMEAWQFTPKNCITCGGDVAYFFEDDDFNSTYADSDYCVCPPQPREFTLVALRYLMNFFSAEWIIRVLVYVPENPDPTFFGVVLQWIGYLTSPGTLIDALATFPYYLETLPNTFVSLRLLRLFRIFQLVRLGQYNTLFLTLTNVMAKSLNYLRLLILILAFGGAFFGSMIYWLEKGTWQYHEDSGTFLFLRPSVDGVTLEPSPFRSIPEAFWWFMVTATTVGYGDYYPTSAGGKWVAFCAMLMGVLVIAFPVSVFSDLWSDELAQVKGFEDLNQDDNDNDNNQETGDTSSQSEIGRNTPSNRGSGLLQHQLAGGTTAYARDSVAMDKKDLKELLECVYNIRKNQRRLQSILRKYGLYEEEHHGF